MNLGWTLRLETLFLFIENKSSDPNKATLLHKEHVFSKYSTS